jgi:hypothetical protein
MKKIPSVFQRNYETDRLIRDEVTPGCEWVLAGEGRATQKFDGTSCLIQSGALYKRYEINKGRTPPEGFIPAQGPDPVTGDCPGWVPVTDAPEDQWHREVFDRAIGWDDGTYELVGPKIQGNPEGFDKHWLILHGAGDEPDVPRTFEGIRDYLMEANIEGIVFHHEDGRMAKVKLRDYGLKRR